MMKAILNCSIHKGDLQLFGFDVIAIVRVGAGTCICMYTLEMLGI